MSILEKAAALLEATGRGDIDAARPADLERFAYAAERAAKLARARLARIPTLPRFRSGVLCALERGERAP